MKAAQEEAAVKAAQEEAATAARIAQEEAAVKAAQEREDKGLCSSVTFAAKEELFRPWLSFSAQSWLPSRDHSAIRNQPLCICCG